MGERASLIASPRQWPMFAGPLDKGVRLHIDSHPRTVKEYGDDPTAVTMVEDAEGSYYGWIDAEFPERGPQMIQPHAGLFAMQFPYGVKAQVERGKGEVVRMRIEEDA